MLHTVHTREKKNENRSPFVFLIKKRKKKATMFQTRHCQLLVSWLFFDRQHARVPHAGLKLHTRATAECHSVGLLGSQPANIAPMVN